jgi:hypothetical protein
MPGENDRMGSWIRLLILLLVLWIAYRVTFVCCKGGESSGDRGNCKWVTDERDAAKRYLVCTLPGGGSIKVDTTGVGSGGNQ